jgi:hypothetical protein
MEKTVRWIVNSPVAVSEILDEELVIINMQKGAYYSGVGSAAFIWRCIEQHVPLEITESAIAEKYGVERQRVGNDITVFLETLSAEGLIRPASAGDVMGGVAPPLGEEIYLSPLLKIYTDMQDLLLLDPIHDVGDQGWPIKPPDAGT